MELSDGARAPDQPLVVLAENAGYWQTQYRPRPTAFTEKKRMCFLQIAGFMSSVLHDVTDASTVAKAFDVLFVGGNNGSATQQLDRQLLTSWLNFANGALDLGTLVDTQQGQGRGHRLLHRDLERRDGAAQPVGDGESAAGTEEPAPSDQRLGDTGLGAWLRLRPLRWLQMAIVYCWYRQQNQRFAGISLSRGPSASPAACRGIDPVES